MTDAAVQPAVSPSVDLDTRLYAPPTSIRPGIQAQLDTELEERRVKAEYPNRPPPGYMRILSTDVDNKGQLWITRFIIPFGNIETKKIGEWLYRSNKSASRR